jgi:hypothetical protein
MRYSQRHLASLPMCFVLSELLFWTVYYNYICICDIPLLSSDLDTKESNDLFRIWDFVVYLPSGGIIFVLPAWNCLYYLRGINWPLSTIFIFDVKIVPTMWYFCFSVFHYITWWYIKSNRKKPEYKEKQIMNFSKWQIPLVNFGNRKN